MATTEHKICKRCGELKHRAEDFHKDAQRDDGRSQRCKACNCEVMREYYARNTEHVKAQKESWFQAHREEMTAARRAHREANHERILATEARRRAAAREAAQKAGN